jgi:predicted kinase
MKYFISISGIPGSGKSTLADFLKKKISAVHISSDMIRKEYFGDPSLDALRYKKPLKTAVIKILDEKAELGILKNNTIIYDSVQSDPSIQEKQLALCNQYNYTFIIIELLFSYSTLKKRILNRTNDPYSSEADLSILNRFYEEKLSFLRLNSNTDEFDLLEKMKDDFVKRREDKKISILIFENKDNKPDVLYFENIPNFLKEGLLDYFKTYFP